MSVSHPAVKAVPAALLSLSALLALSISLLLTACGMYPSDSFVPRRKRADYTLVVFGVEMAMIRFTPCLRIHTQSTC